jgi:hypothetical protein
MFVGDPAGEAITQGALSGITPALAGRAGYVYLGEEGAAERTFNGVTRNPQPVLEAKQFTMPHGSRATYTNGPNDVSNVPSSAAGQVFLDARYRALAARAMRSSS